MAWTAVARASAPATFSALASGPCKSELLSSHARCFCTGQRAFALQRPQDKSEKSGRAGVVRAGTHIWGTPPTVTKEQREKAAAELEADAAAMLKEVETVQRLRNGRDLQNFLNSKKEQLAVVEYGTSRSAPVQKMQPALVGLSKMCKDVAFALVLGDESDDTKAMMAEAGVKKLPHFAFYKGGQKVHEEVVLDEESLQGNVFYLGDSTSVVHDLHSREELDALMVTAGDKLVVVDVGITRCGPCVKVYPTVVRLAQRMSESAIFARVMVDKNEWSSQLMKEEGIQDVPTFLFLKNGESSGRYVGSSPGALIGEVLKRQGVRIT